MLVKPARWSVSPMLMNGVRQMQCHVYEERSSHVLEIVRFEEMLCCTKMMLRPRYHTRWKKVDPYRKFRSCVSQSRLLRHVKLGASITRCSSVGRYNGFQFRTCPSDLPYLIHSVMLQGRLYPQPSPDIHVQSGRMACQTHTSSLKSRSRSRSGARSSYRSKSKTTPISTARTAKHRTVSNRRQTVE